MKWYSIILGHLLLLWANTGPPPVEGFGLLGAATVGIISAVGTFFAKDPVKCIFECCHERSNGKFVTNWINYDANFDDFDKKIFGQHIALEVVTKSVRQHLKNDNPPKALVLSFHGYTGVGKNHLSKLIAKAIYTQYNLTEESKFVHTLIATHFLSGDITQDRARLKKVVESGIATCERSLFIIDEVDKFPQKFLDTLIPYIESNKKIDGNGFNKAIFLLLGNSGGDAINWKTNELRSAGFPRDSISYKEYDSILHSKALREGGLKDADLIDRGIIDLFVPFLPLEKEHVKMCIVQYLRDHRNYTQPEMKPGKQFIEKVADQITFIPDTDVYSRFGCKRVPTTVDIMIIDD